VAGRDSRQGIRFEARNADNGREIGRSDKRRSRSAGRIGVKPVAGNAPAAAAVDEQSCFRTVKKAGPEPSFLLGAE
jgi:hypothetical protein